MVINTLKNDTLAVQKVLLIGGIDPSINAGLLLDTLTVVEQRLHPQVVVTTVTAQNSSTFIGYEKISNEMIDDQLKSITTEEKFDAVKIGMLGSKSAVEAIATYFEDNPHSNIVLDPLLKSSSGSNLIGEVGYHLLKVRLLPLANIVTPNLPEAEKLSEMTISNFDEATEAARLIHMLGPQSVLITGGHFLEGENVTDIFYNGNKCYKLSGPRLDKENVRGTGCILSASIACKLAKGKSTLEAVSSSEKYCRNKIKKSRKSSENGIYQTEISKFGV